MTLKLETKREVKGREVRSFALQIKAIAEDGSIEGYGSVFGVKDHYCDVIASGAFKATIAEHKSAGTMPAMLWQHDADEPIGIWSEMSEDSNGLFLKGRLAITTEKGRDAYELLKMKAVNGLSIGFVSKAWAYDETTEIRTLTEVDLWEVSLVTFPANEAARITNVKAAIDEITAPREAELALRESGFSKADATAFVSRVMRMGEARREAANSTSEALKAAARLISNLKT